MIWSKRKDEPLTTRSRRFTLKAAAGISWSEVGPQPSGRTVSRVRAFSQVLALVASLTPLGSTSVRNIGA